MKALVKTYDAVIVGLATIAGAMVAAVFVAIVWDVSLRTIGLQPPLWTSALTEYALLYMTMLAAPWLVRVKGHVFVESLAMMLPIGVRRLVEKAVYLITILLCVVLAYFALDQGLEIAARGDEDIRSIVLPKWALYAPLPVGFGLSEIEFLRFLIGNDSMYAGRSLSEGL